MKFFTFAKVQDLTKAQTENKRAEIWDAYDIATKGERLRRCSAARFEQAQKAQKKLLKLSRLEMRIVVAENDLKQFKSILPRLEAQEKRLSAEVGELLKPFGLSIDIGGGTARPTIGENGAVLMLRKVL